MRAMSANTWHKILKIKTRVDSILKNAQAIQHERQRDVDETSNRVKNKRQNIEDSIELQIKMSLSYSLNRNEINDQTKSNANDHELHLRFVNESK